MEQTWTIGELADAVGVSTRTIRHDEVGKVGRMAVPRASAPSRLTEA